MDAQEKLYFTSSYSMGKKEYKDMNSVSYQNPLRHIRFLVILALLAGLVLPILGDEFSITILWASSVMFLASFMLYLGVGRAVQSNYTRKLLLSGKESEPYTTQLGEKIVVHGEEGSTREFDYSEIKRIKQTGLFYLLHLGDVLYIIVGKDVVSCVDGLEFIPFLMERCTSLKKKKIIDCTHYKTKALGYVIVTGAIVMLDLLMLVL